MGEFVSTYLKRLRAGEGTVAVELRPPPMERSGTDAMDAWIDLHHGVRRLARAGKFLFLTDNAVGAAEEENLAHLGANLSEEVDPGSVAPFLTCKHSMDYCLRYAERAWAQGFRALGVLGGDQQIGPPRCVPHAYLLRQRIRDRVPGLALGGWANPHGDAQTQAGYLASDSFTGEFWLSQVVSHHSADRVEEFLDAVEKDGISTPGVFGVFYYRSGNPKTLGLLSEFFPVPDEELTAEFEKGVPPEEICARSIRALRELGVSDIYLSNLPVRRPMATLGRILAML